jgi:hypothetical protein
MIEDKRIRALVTFAPWLFLLPFDPLLAITIELVLFEKCILCLFPIPGIEFTSLATILYGIKYDILTGVFLAVAVPGVLASLYKYLLWQEFKRPDEAPVNIGFGNFVDSCVVLLASLLKNMELLYIVLACLVFKHTVNFVKGKYSGSVDVIGPLMSTFLNVTIVLLFGKYLLILAGKI